MQEFVFWMMIVGVAFTALCVYSIFKFDSGTYDAMGGWIPVSILSGGAAVICFAVFALYWLWRFLVYASGSS
jgi:hypothetical protein